MAKAKENTALDSLIKDGLVKYGNDPRLIIKRMPIGIPMLDDLLGGGLPMGRCTMAYGEESTGKTIIAQYAAAAVQRSERPLVLYMDMERSYDEPWWIASGVDTSQLLVSTPMTAEQAIDIMRSMLQGSSELGMIILDSIPAMTPMPEMDPEKSSEDKTIGLQARVITLMFRQIMPLLEDKVIFYVCNQMRESIGKYNEIAGLPGGRAIRHNSHIILRTRRESWIKDDKANTGFYMEITSRKNKVASTPDGSFVLLPFMFSGKIDMLTAYLEDAKARNIITRKPPYFYWNDKAFHGMPNLRQYFLDNEEEMRTLEALLV